jgi:hypothetical protein
MKKLLTHGFAVSKIEDQIVVFQCERFDQLAPVTYLADRRARVSMPVSRWHKIAPDFERVAAERLSETNAGKFRFPKKLGTALVPSSLGKELCVLCWGAETASDEDFTKIIRNWNGLAPEERWWLYNVTVANCGQALQVGKGWRKAIHAALVEEGITK